MSTPQVDNASPVTVRIALARAALCRALARMLDVPSEEHRAEAGRRLAIAFQRCDGPASLRTALAAVGRELERAPATLESEHVRLFGPAGVAPLVETAWGDVRRTAGPAAVLADLAGFYRAFGVEPGGPRPRPEDHLGLELEFLGVLALKEAWAIAEELDEARGVTREATAAFLRDHLGSWVEAWRSAVAASDPPALYAALAEAIAAFVTSECARLGVTPDPLARRLPTPRSWEDAVACPRAAAEAGITASHAPDRSG